jgi:hypothetical protein
VQRRVCHLDGRGASGVLAGDQHRLHGLEENLADQGNTGRIDGGDGAEQDRGRGLVPREEHGDRRPQSLGRYLQTCRSQPGRRPVQQCLSQGAISGDQMRRGGGEQPHGPVLRLRRQLRRPGQERGLRDEAAAPFRPPGGGFKFGRDSLVRDDGSRGAVPRRLVRVAVPASNGRQGVVDPAPIARPGTLIDRGADQRVPERHPRIKRHDVLRYRGIGGIGCQAKQRCCPPQRRGIIARRRRCEQQQRAGRGRQHLHLTQEVRLHATAGWQPLRQRRAAGQLVCGELPGDLAQRERVTAGIGDDP